MCSRSELLLPVCCDLSNRPGLVQPAPSFSAPPQSSLSNSQSLHPPASSRTRNPQVVGEDIVSAVILGYTREAGVRGLERALSALCRAAAVEVAERPEGSPEWNRPIVCTAEMVERALGPPKYTGSELTDRRAMCCVLCCVMLLLVLPPSVGGLVSRSLALRGAVAAGSRARRQQRSPARQRT